MRIFHEIMGIIFKTSFWGAKIVSFHTKHFGSCGSLITKYIQRHISRHSKSLLCAARSAGWCQGPHMCLVKFLIYCNMDCEHEFPRQLLARDIDERVALEQPERRDQDNRKVPYTCAGAETRPEERRPHALGWCQGSGPGDSHLCNNLAPRVVTMRHFSISAK